MFKFLHTSDWPETFSYITDRSKAIVLLWFSVACFWCQIFGDVFTLRVFILFLVRFRLLSGHLWEIAAYSFDHKFSFVF